MSFKDQMRQDVVSAFLNPNEFGELISYVPKGGTAKSIYAIVDRKRIQPAGEDSGRTLINQVEIVIANSSTDGVISINKGGDTVSLPERVGDTAITWAVADVLGQDEGCWHLLLQK